MAEQSTNSTTLDPIRIGQIALAAVALVGAGIERTLHYLLAGKNYPEFQFLVVQITGTALCLFCVIVALFGAGLFAVEIGKADRQSDHIWKKRGLRVLAVLTIGLMILLVFVFSELGSLIFADGSRQFIESVKKALGT